MAAASGTDGNVHIYDTVTATRTHSLAHDNRVCAMTVVGAELWVATWDRRVYVWDPVRYANVCINECNVLYDTSNYGCQSHAHTRVR